MEFIYIFTSLLDTKNNSDADDRFVYKKNPPTPHSYYIISWHVLLTDDINWVYLCIV